MSALRLPRIDLQPLAWGAAAIALSVGGGLVAGHSARMAFDVAMVVLAAVLISSRPYIALLVVLIVLASVPGREVIPYLLLFSGALALLVRAPSLPGKRVSVPLLLFLAIALLSTPVHPSPDEGLVPAELHLPLVRFPYASTPSVELHDWLQLSAGLVVFLLAAWSVRTRRRLELLVRAVLVSAVVPIGVAFSQLLTGKTYERIGTTLKSVRGTFAHPNYLAFYLVIVLVVAVLAFFETPRLYPRIGLSILLGAGLATLFLTYTRSAWIGFALALVVMGVLRYRRLLLIAFVGLAVAAFVAPGATKKAEQRFGDLTSKSAANDTNSWRWRVDQWSAMINYGFDRPLTGEGWDSYTRLTVRRFGHFDQRYPTVRYPAYGVYSSLGFTAHNDYVKDFAELGVPGLVLWVLTLGGLIAVAWRARRVPWAAGLAVAMVGVGVAVLLMSASDNLQGYTAVLTYGFALGGALAGATAGTAGVRRPRLRALGVSAAAPGVSAAAPGVSAAAPGEDDAPELEIATAAPEANGPPPDAVEPDAHVPEAVEPDAVAQTDRDARPPREADAHQQRQEPERPVAAADRARAQLRRLFGNRRRLR